MIVRVSVFIRRTVCGDIDWRFDNLSGSHHQCEVNCEQSVDCPGWSTKVAMFWLVCQLSREVV